MARLRIAGQDTEGGRERRRLRPDRRRTMGWSSVPLRSCAPCGERRGMTASPFPERALALVFRRAFWTAVLCTHLSSDGSSAPSTRRVIGPLVRWFFPGISQERFELVHFTIRKSAYVTEDAVPARLALRALQRAAPRREGQCSTSRTHARPVGRVGRRDAPIPLLPADRLADGGRLGWQRGAFAFSGALVWNPRFGVRGRCRYRSPGCVVSDSRGAPSHGEDV